MKKNLDLRSRFMVMVMVLDPNLRAAEIFFFHVFFFVIFLF